MIYEEQINSRFLSLTDGLCLPQASLFFACPKKSKQKKGHPQNCRIAILHSAAARRVKATDGFHDLVPDPALLG